MIKCPVCKGYDFNEDNDFDVCDICGWENDGMQLDDPDDWGGSNDLTLNSARLEYMLLTNLLTSHETQMAQKKHNDVNSAIHLKYKGIDHRIDGESWSNELRNEYERYLDVLKRIESRVVATTTTFHESTYSTAEAV